MAEALTQDWAARDLNANQRPPCGSLGVYNAFSRANPACPIGYIVMEYIDAPDCDEGDDQLVARAVQTLICIQGPSSAPGPVGGGRVIHNFSTEWTSAITYYTVKKLQEHMNGLFKYMGDTRRVDVEADAPDGLRLCPCDITPGNFKKYRDVAMEKVMGIFAWKVSNLVSYPKSNDVAAMVAASYVLVPYGKNDIGMPRSLRRIKGL